jgi:hypothetical protein
VIEAVKKHVENKFGLESVSNVVDKTLFIRVPGLDNYSLARWIKEEFLHIRVEVDYINHYAFSDNGWVKVENELE